MSKPISITKSVLFFLLATLLVVSYLIYSNDVVETWLAKQVIHLTQTDKRVIQFSSVDYRFPATLAVKDLQFNEAKAFQLTANQIITDIDSISLNHLTLKHIYAHAPKFTYLQQKVKEETSSNNSDIKTTQSNNFAFLIKHIQLDDAHFIFKAIDNAHSFQIPSFHADMKISNENNQEYHLQLTSNDKQALVINANAVLNLTSQTITLENTNLTLDFSHEKILEILPSITQSTFAIVKPEKKFTIDAAGQINLTNVADSKVTTKFSTENILFSLDTNQVPIQQSEGELVYENKFLDIPKFILTANKGTIEFSKVKLNFSHPINTFKTDWKITEFDLEQINNSKNNKTDGFLSSTGEITANLNPWLIQSGKGDITVTEGQLMKLPVLSELVSLLNVKGLIQGEFKQNDKLTGTFSLDDKAITIANIDIENLLLAARIKGSANYAGDLDLIVNAGPIEKIGMILGPVGMLANLVTDQILAYKVSGTIEKPKVTPRVLGISMPTLSDTLPSL